MCKWGTLTEITIERRLSVDSCIAPLIVALNKAGIYTTSCCCGHDTALPVSVLFLPSCAEHAKELGVPFRDNPHTGDPEILIGREGVPSLVQRLEKHGQRGV